MTQQERDAMARYFPPVDWSKSALGRDVWHAWNALDSAIMWLAGRPFSEATDNLVRLQEARRAMADALRRRDAEPAP